jgi:hypothetical protein
MKLSPETTTSYCVRPAARATLHDQSAGTTMNPTMPTATNNPIRAHPLPIEASRRKEQGSSQHEIEKNRR